MSFYFNSLNNSLTANWSSLCGWLTCGALVQCSVYSRCLVLSVSPTTLRCSMVNMLIGRWCLSHQWPHRRRLITQLLQACPSACRHWH